MQAATFEKAIGVNWDDATMRRMLFHGTDAGAVDSIKTNGIPVPIIASIVGIVLALMGTLALYRYHSSGKAEDKTSAEDVNNEKINADIKDNSVVTEDSDDTNVN